jgi:hypothetical protein
MDAHESIGYLASLLVLATFCMSGMVPLRAIAIASNVAFIGYAALAGISPVLLLHALLLPMNVYRLLQALRERRHDQAAVIGWTRRHGRKSFGRAAISRSNRCAKRDSGNDCAQRAQGVR